MTLSDMLNAARRRGKKRREEGKREESDNDKENQQALSFYINKPVKETILFIYLRRPLS